jgi:branched-chain amino acid transport system permease protein
VTVSLSRRVIPWALFLGVALLAPVVITSRHYTTLLVAMTFAIYIGTCWNILGGLAGPHSLGHASFIGIGAYTSTLLFIDHGITPWLGMFAGALLATLLAVVLGVISFRYAKLGGAYFLMVTLAISLILLAVAQSTEAFGAARGLAIPYSGQDPANMQFADPKAYYWVILPFLVVAMGVMQFMKRGRLGYAFAAIRLDEDAAAAAGVNVAFYKTLAFGVSAFLTALGGTFYAQYYQYIDAQSVFGLEVSVMAMVYPIVGGLGSVFGSLLGGGALYPISEIIKESLRTVADGVDILVYGLALIFTMMLLPGGIVSLGRGIRSLIVGRFSRPTPGAAAGIDTELWSGPEGADLIDAISRPEKKKESHV